MKRRQLTQARRARGLSQEALAERLGVDPRTVGRWERGESEPQPWLRPNLVRVLGIAPGHLDVLLAATGDDSQDDRLCKALDQPSGTDLVAVAHLRDQVRRLDADYDRAPSTSLLPQTGQCLGQASFLRDHARSNVVRRELRVVETEAATLMGQLVWDASQRRDHATAHSYFDRAVSSARELRDPVAESRALLRKSFVALYGEKSATKGLQLTMRTAEVATSSSHVLAGLAVLHSAEAHAMLGARTECERALLDADDHFALIDDADAALELFSPTQPGRLAGSCYLALGRPEQAEPILEATARTLRDRSKSRAIVLGNLALAHIRQAELDAAVDVLHQALDVIEHSRGGGGLNVVAGACRELRPWRNVVAVQDAYDRVMNLITV